MRIWDIDPGYLNRQSLLAEHQELHGLIAAVRRQDQRFLGRAEVLRWLPHLDALALRHRWLVEEMSLRGYNHRSPVDDAHCEAQWPETFLLHPHQQFEDLGARYVAREPGRIPLPKKIHQLWAQHKYSVMARDPALGSGIGRDVAAKNITFEQLAANLTQILRVPPDKGRLLNALEHMWGYVSDQSGQVRDELETAGALLSETRKLVMDQKVAYLMHSTALGELGRFVLT